MTVADTNQHYDLDPRIFALYLDSTLKYSSGLYTSPEDTLETAQQRKLHYVARHLELGPGRSLLDVGSGWGSLVLFAAEHYGVRAEGISPAPRQRAYAEDRAVDRGLADRIAIRTGHFEEYERSPRSLDAISMLGSIVHMPDLGAAFAKCHRLLRPRGMLYVSESCYRNSAKRAEFASRTNSMFVRDTIFGWGDMRPLSDLVRAAEDAGFTVAAVDDLTAHYRRTIDDWLASVERNRGDLDAIEPGLAGTLTRYLRTANAGWGFTTKHYALVCRRSR